MKKATSLLIAPIAILGFVGTVANTSSISNAAVANSSETTQHVVNKGENTADKSDAVVIESAKDDTAAEDNGSKQTDSAELKDNKVSTRTVYTSGGPTPEAQKEASREIDKQKQEQAQNQTETQENKTSDANTATDGKTTQKQGNQATSTQQAKTPSSTTNTIQRASNLNSLPQAGADHTLSTVLSSIGVVTAIVAGALAFIFKKQTAK